MTYYWIIVDGVKVYQFAHTDRLTTLEKTLQASRFANEHGIPSRVISVREVDKRLFRVGA